MDDDGNLSIRIELTESGSIQASLSRLMLVTGLNFASKGWNGPLSEIGLDSSNELNVQ